MPYIMYTEQLDWQIWTARVRTEICIPALRRYSHHEVLKRASVCHMQVKIFHSYIHVNGSREVSNAQSEEPFANNYKRPIGYFVLFSGGQGSTMLNDY